MPRDSYDRDLAKMRVEQALAKATDEQILAELTRRGYHGKLIKEKPKKE
jgi:hypothetical protein